LIYQWSTRQLVPPRDRAVRPRGFGWRESTCFLVGSTRAQASLHEACSLFADRSFRDRGLLFQWSRRLRRDGWRRLPANANPRTLRARVRVRRSDVWMCSDRGRRTRFKVLLDESMRARARVRTRRDRLGLWSLHGSEPRMQREFRLGLQRRGQRHGLRERYLLLQSHRGRMRSGVHGQWRLRQRSNV
jgi:hypothetical protein